MILTHEIFIDVRRTLHQPNGMKSTSPGALILLLDIAVVAGDLSDDVHGDGVLEVARAGHVEEGFVGTCTVGRDDVQSAGD